jgi:exodeoxyribonuclease VII large subunit
VNTDLFGVPEPVSSGPRIFSVSEITRSVRNALESQIGTVWVEGEISNYRKQASGHQYFTLKDDGSQLSCVLFQRPGMWRKQVALSDGMCVQVRGALTVYEARGQYQLNVQLVQPAGAGLLQARFEALKRKLDAQGLFGAERKRPLPILPTMLAIVTSPTGAALRDMLNILTRRAPWVRVIVSPVRVQGDGAAEEIANAVEELNRFTDFGLRPVDLIIVARGGGSAEDLWAFNEEVVAHAIAASEIPVMSAVGHEIDFTIADLVADLRAPTPSAAAELAVPDRAELMRRLDGLAALARRHLLLAVEQARARLSWAVRSELFREPQLRTTEAAQRLDGAVNALQRATGELLEAMRRRLREGAGKLRPQQAAQMLAAARVSLAALQKQIDARSTSVLSERGQQLRRLGQVLRVLSPEATLARGYTMTSDSSGGIIASAQSVESGARLVTHFRDGRVNSTAD